MKYSIENLLDNFISIPFNAQNLKTLDICTEGPNKDLFKTRSKIRAVPHLNFTQYPNTDSTQYNDLKFVEHSI